MQAQLRRCTAGTLLPYHAVQDDLAHLTLFLKVFKALLLQKSKGQMHCHHYCCILTSRPAALQATKSSFSTEAHPDNVAAATMIAETSLTRKWVALLADMQIWEAYCVVCLPPGATAQRFHGQDTDHSQHCHTAVVQLTL